MTGVKPGILIQCRPRIFALFRNPKILTRKSKPWVFGVKNIVGSHSDGSCVLGRIHSDVSSNILKKVYHIVTDNFVNLLHISYAWLYKTECWGSKFHAFSFNSHRNCKIFMTNFNFIFDTICVPYIFRKSIFGWNCDHDTPLCDTPLLEDTPLCDTPDDMVLMKYPMISTGIKPGILIQCRPKSLHSSKIPRFWQAKVGHGFLASKKLVLMKYQRFWQLFYLTFWYNVGPKSFFSLKIPRMWQAK